MITQGQPSDWRALQTEVARILSECGMETSVEKQIRLARGQVEVDVFAVETVRGREYTIFCECKYWSRSVPQSVVHAFRSVVSDGGANVGYLITSSSFQSGAFAAAELTNVRLVTWPAFQDEFERTWIERHLRPTITEKLDGLMSLVEPLLPPAFEELSPAAKDRFLEIRERHSDLGAIAMSFTTYMTMLSRDVPRLPLRGRLPSVAIGRVPDEVLDALGYRELLDALLTHGERAVAELRSALHPPA